MSDLPKGCGFRTKVYRYVEGAKIAGDESHEGECGVVYVENTDRFAINLCEGCLKTHGIRW